MYNVKGPDKYSYMVGQYCHGDHYILCIGKELYMTSHDDIVKSVRKVAGLLILLYSTKAPFM